MDNRNIKVLDSWSVKNEEMHLQCIDTVTENGCFINCYKRDCANCAIDCLEILSDCFSEAEIGSIMCDGWEVIYFPDINQPSLLIIKNIWT